MFRVCDSNTSLPTIVQCLQNAKAACGSDIVNANAVTNVYDIILSTCGKSAFIFTS